PDVLLAALEQRDVVQRALSPVSLWPRFCYQVQMTDPAIGARYERARIIAAQTNAAISFVEPEIVQIGFDTIEQWITRAPKLADHQRMLDRLKHRLAHVCSPDVERALSLAGD